MSNLFYGINIARNTLITQSTVLNTTAHNIANSSTPGYSRQEVILSSASEMGGQSYLRSGLLMSVGNGVEAKEIRRNRFALFDELYRKENQDFNAYTKTEELMNQVELFFDEPNDGGLSAIINDFFTGWQEASGDPQNMAARQSLKSTASELADRFHRIYSQLENMRSDIDTEITGIPAIINEITTEIADLNSSIRIAQGQNEPANDLRDKRDTLVDELSEYVDVKAIEQADGTYTVLIGNNVVVERDNQSVLRAVTRIDEMTNMKKTVILSEENMEYRPTSGKTGALIDFRDSTLGDIMDQLNTFTENLVKWVNFQHGAGYGLDGSTGRNFFDPTKTKAYNIEVSTDISDVSTIALSGDGTVGDNTNGQAINGLKDLKLIDNNYTFSEYYGSLIATVGVWGREAQAGRENEELLVSQVDNARESIKGVNMDEELIQMIQAQRIYQSASRIISVMDGLLEEILQLTA